MMNKYPKPRRGKKSFRNALRMAAYLARAARYGGYYPTVRDVRDDVDEKGFKSTSQVYDSGTILESLGLVNPHGRRRGYRLEGTVVAVPQNYIDGSFFGGEYEHLLVDRNVTALMPYIKKMVTALDTTSYLPELKTAREYVNWLFEQERKMPGSMVIVTHRPEAIIAAVALSIHVYNPATLVRAGESEYYKDHGETIN
jgi:hypothetical protein